ncbi:MAG: DUF5716 family protein [Oscillospiraceae bacterium]|nr:DUF5716 family protein [Oscillospiraceae bacterium]
MNAFDRIPNNFFNLLAGNSNYRINSGCLLEVYELFENEISYRISRDSVRDTIASYLMTVNENSETDPGDMSPNDRAGAVIRSFYEAGWLSEETDDVSYEKQIVMTEAGIALAEFLTQLISPSKEEYSSYVFNIYNRLINREQWSSNPYTFALKPVYYDAKKLADSLKKLSTSIRSIIEKVVEEKTLEELTNNLMSYCEGSFIKEYSRLIKEQKIHIYRPAILKELERMRRDTDIYELIVIDCFDSEGCDDEAAAEQRVHGLFETTIRFLSDDYNRITNDIQKKINIYLNLAVGRARFLLSHDENTRGSVQQVLKQMVEAFDKGDDIPAYGELYELYTQEFIDTASLRFPSKQKVIRSAAVTEIPEMTQADLDRAAEQQRKEINNPYSKEKMKDYVLALMGDKTEITADSFPAERKTDILAVLSAAAYAGQNGFELTPDDRYIERNGSEIRSFTISRRDKGVKK